MQEDVVPGFTTNGVKDFSDGMANMEVEMNLKTPVHMCDIVCILSIKACSVCNMPCFRLACQGLLVSSLRRSYVFVRVEQSYMLF